MGKRSNDPGEFIRDLVMYAPLGALLILRDQAEEFINDAIDRGRRQQRQVDAAVNNQVSVVKSVGKNQLRKMVGRAEARSGEAPFSAVRKVGDVVVRQAQQAAEDVVSQLPAEGPVKSIAGTGQEVIRQAQEQMGVRLLGAPRDAASGGKGNGQRDSRTVAPPVGGAEHLAIADYESLSAAQINARLGGLTRDELGDVEEYENAHRARKTVLARVAQEITARK